MKKNSKDQLEPITQGFHLPYCPLVNPVPYPFIFRSTFHGDFRGCFYNKQKPFNSRNGQRTNQKYRNLVGSDQQMQRFEETELRKADRTVGVDCWYLFQILENI